MKHIYLSEKAPSFKGVKDKRRNTYLLAYHLVKNKISPYDFLHLYNTGRMPIDIEYKINNNFDLTWLMYAVNDIRAFGVKELVNKRYIPIYLYNSNKVFFKYLNSLMKRSFPELYQSLK